MKRITLLAILFFILLIPQFVMAEDVYDVILFWGQSNMVGRAGKLDKEKDYDARVTSLGISGFSSAADIKMSIVKNYTALNHVSVPLEEGTAYEYRLSSDSLVELSSDTTSLGETLYAKKKNGKVTFSTKGSGTATVTPSAGTNMIPQFAYAYYKQTGHKVIAVMCAHNGMDIASFLPQSVISEYDGDEEFYMYDEMVAAYSGAISYLEEHDMQVGNKFYVVMQGEADVKTANKYYLENNSLDYDDYYEKFMIVHNSLKEDLGLSFGVIAETAYTLGSNKAYGVEVIHLSQEKLALNNDDIVIGSTYAYKHFIPASSFYEGKESYSSLYLQYRNAMSVVGDDESNMIHFNSAALSQIGDDCAYKAAEVVNPKVEEVSEPSIKENIILQVDKIKVGNWKFDLFVGILLLLIAFNLYLFKKLKRR